MTSSRWANVRRMVLPPMLRLRRRSLRTWLLVGALVLVACVAGALIAAEYFESRAAAHVLAQSEVRSVWQRAHARVVQLLRAAEMMTESAEDSMGLPLDAPADWPAFFERLVPAFEQRPELTYLGYATTRTGEAGFLRRRLDGVLEFLCYVDLAPDHRVIRTYRYQNGTLSLWSEQPWDGYDPRKRPYFEAAVAARRPTWTGLYPFSDPDKHAQIYGVTYAAPFLTPDGTIAGVWDADFDTRALSAFMRQMETETGAHTFVVETSSDGKQQRLVAHPDPDQSVGTATGPRSFKDWMSAEAARRFPGSQRTWLGYDGGLEPPHPRWTVLAIVPESSSASAYLASRLVPRMGIIAGALLVAFLGSAVFAQRMARPVEALREAVAGVAAGEHPTLIAGTAPRELISLHAAFEDMTEAVEERQRAVEASNENLRHEVRQRAEREALLQAVFAHAPFELWVVDRAGVCVMQNTASRARLGDLAGRPFFAAAPEFAQALRWNEHFSRALGGDVVVRNIEGRSGGRAVYSEAVLAPIRADGSVTGLVCVNIDLTEQKRAEDALRTSQRRLSLHLENTPLGVIDWTPDFVVAAWNPAAEMIFGWPAQEAIGRHAHFIVPERERAGVESSWAEMVGRGGAARYSNQNVRRDGTIIECEWYSTVLTDADGRVSGVSSLVLDVTERTAIERAYRESEDRFRKAFRSAPVPQAVVRRIDRVVLDVNDAWEVTFGIERDNAAGKTAMQLGFWPDTATRNSLVQELEHSGHVRDREVEFPLANGRVGTVLLSITLVELANEPCMLISQVDITRRKRAENEVRALNETLEQRVVTRTAELAEANDRLKEVDRLKSEFLATMSHELRTPLNSILGFSSILQEGMAGPINSEQARQIGMVHSSAQHLLVLINDLLDLSRIEAGRMEIHLAQVNLAEIMREVEQTLAPMVKAKGLAYETGIAPSLPAVISDRKRLFQILLNLANNAVKFTERGRVRVEAGAVGESVRITVHDTGIGIREEHLSRLFEAFRQIDGSARRVHEGTGLGLYLVRKLLGLLGGSIEVESRFGSGSVFTVLIPLAAPVTTAHHKSSNPG